MNHVFLEESTREKVGGLRFEGLASQEFYRNRTKKPNRFYHFFSSTVVFLKTIPNLIFSKRKHPAVYHKPY